jgi:hypothetical protein
MKFQRPNLKVEIGLRLDGIRELTVNLNVTGTVDGGHRRSSINYRSGGIIGKTMFARGRSV